MREGPLRLFVARWTEPSVHLSPRLPKEGAVANEIFQPPNFYAERRHNRVRETPSEKSKALQAPADWRMRERLKTVSAVMIICLNIGVDPPDLVRTHPSAKLECWIDPFSLTSSKALEAIGRNLQTQYEVLQPRARFRVSPDPSVEETKKLCCSLRRNAKEERALFHYNGHGVPKPTQGGELWVFNKNYTQYIPISIYDIQTWIGSPCVYVYDCSNAGNILHAFNRFAAQRDAELAAEGRLATKDQADGDKEVQVPMESCIQLAACQANQVLPMNPDLPADVFTSCLTTPLEIALRWAVTQNPLLNSITPDMIMKIPGRLNDRRTPLGELNWIFTAVTDTIAWTSLSHDLFKRLYRQDLMVAALFRNFLLAERIMRYYGCTPLSSPVLPPTHQHTMWQSWDLAADFCVAQLPALLSGDKDGKTAEYQNSTFFAEQLTAFDVWLSKGLTAEDPPEQLPIVLQVLLSQIHRLRAMMLLSRFLDMGPWAVNLALLVGIFPYVLKLLQSPAPELKPLLVFIWTKILVVDRSCQADLLKDNGFMYFVKLLSPGATMPMAPNPSGLRTMCAFILSVFCHKFPAGQQACLKGEVLPAIVEHLMDEDPLLRQWSCICAGKVWEDYPEAKATAMEQNMHEKLIRLLRDPVPDVRAAALSALRGLIGGVQKSEKVAMIHVHIASAALMTVADASPLVRRELVCALSAFAREDNEPLVAIATEMVDETLQMHAPPASSAAAAPPTHAVGSVSSQLADSNTPGSQYIWKGLLTLSVDPFPEVAVGASALVDHMISQTLVSRSEVDTPPISSQDAPPIRGQARSLSSTKGSDRSSEMNGMAEAVSRQLSVVAGQNGDADGSKPAPATTATMTTTTSWTGIDVDAFFEWSCTFFAEPQMQTPDIDDPGSLRFIERQWRTERNRELSSEQLVTPSYGPVEILQETGRLNVLGTGTTEIAFHSFETHALTSNGRSNVIVHDWSDSTKLQNFDMGNPLGSRISYLRFINENDLTLVAVGSDDGVIKLYSDYEKPYKIKKISGWRALPDLGAASTSSLADRSMVVDWHQSSGVFMCGGDSKVVRVWDANKESCVQVIPTKHLRAVTSLSTHKTGGNLIFTGFADGRVHVYDRRQAPHSSLVRSYKEHLSRILSIRLVTAADGSLLTSGSSSGDVRLWDLRQAESVRQLDVLAMSDRGGSGGGYATHEQTPTAGRGRGGKDSTVRIGDIDGHLLGTTRSTEGGGGFLTQRSSSNVGPVVALAFHPQRLLIASTTTTTPWVSLYSMSTAATAPVDPSDMFA
ncbi:raptor N-terminal caspase like domain-containing protein [Fimicolochytrium jonesii]|uniref:raptor N-terminal caspase like domain-containing protein n=1 Tax=Fimicolochytrium jonesii TaxID=1396493 RepID=UPI0022FF43A5|nr:raptor N-terminal caspase like domain-containing protein [Fimicolochytrium jonesii]KAI8821522.1 raptor N-terminal caspase like domain-containing protein [Fimicolochytrium jonesii]